jgi:DNA topoisomerase-1
LLQKFYDDFKPMLDAALHQKKTPTGLKCPECKQGKLNITEGRRGEYLTCSRIRSVPSSDFLREDGEIQIVEPEKTAVCEKCGSDMVCAWASKASFGLLEISWVQTAMSFTRDEGNKIIPQLCRGYRMVCKKCGKPMAIKKGRHGEFLRLHCYPDARAR